MFMWCPRVKHQTVVTTTTTPTNTGIHWLSRRRTWNSQHNHWSTGRLWTPVYQHKYTPVLLGCHYVLLSSITYLYHNLWPRCWGSVDSDKNNSYSTVACPLTGCTLEHFITIPESRHWKIRNTASSMWSTRITVQKLPADTMVIHKRV